MTEPPSEPSFTTGLSDVPVAGKPAEHEAAAKNVSAETRELQADVEQARGDLGDTVEALAAKADMKARAEETVGQFKANAQETAERVKVGAQQGAERLRLGAKEGLAAAKIKAVRAKQAVQDPQNAGKVKSGGAASAGITALAAVAWAVRRRRNRPKTPGEKVAYVAGQAWDRAVDIGEAALRSDQAAQAVKLGRRAAKKGQELAPEATSRRKGRAVVLVGTIAGLGVAYRVLNENSEEPK